MPNQYSLFDYLEYRDLFSTKESVENFSRINEKKFDELGIYKPVAFYWIPHLRTEIYVYSTNKNYAKEDKKRFRSNILSSSLGFKYKKHMYRKLNKKKYRDAMKDKDLIDKGSLYLHNLESAIAAHDNYASNPYELVPQVFDEFKYGLLLAGKMHKDFRFDFKDKKFHSSDFVFIKENYANIGSYSNIAKTIIYYPKSRKARRSNTRIIVKLEPVFIDGEPKNKIYVPSKKSFISINTRDYEELKEKFRYLVRDFIRDREDVYETIYRIEDGY